MLKLFCHRMHFLCEIDSQSDFLLRIPCQRCKCSFSISFVAARLTTELVRAVKPEGLQRTDLRPQAK